MQFPSSPRLDEYFIGAGPTQAEAKFCKIDLESVKLLASLTRQKGLEREITCSPMKAVLSTSELSQCS